MTVSSSTRTVLCALALYALAYTGACIAADPQPASDSLIDVLHYAARIEPDLRTRTLKGVVAIEFRGRAREAVLDAGSLEIDAVEIEGKPVPFSREDTRVRVLLPRLRRGRGALEVRYHGAPAYGMEFHPERNELYTIFSTSQWMVCVDSPAERATLDLAVVAPAGFTVAATGRPAGKRSLPSGSVEHRWRLTTPVPSFAYGLAVGRYASASATVRERRLTYLSTDRTPEELQRIFRDTADMVRFFEDRAGFPLSDDYRQVLVTETAGQEAAGLALLSEAYGKSVLDDPAAEGLIAHELAHQWWGISVTCRDWGHFWLNEGFATFMAAAYMGQRHGDAEYLRQVGKWKARLDKLRASGNDHPLVYRQWAKPTADDRAVVYQKGAYALHLLRKEMGDTAFWTGIRDYTRANRGRSVDTADFQAAMSRAAGRDLSCFFTEWVQR